MTTEPPISLRPYQSDCVDAVMSARNRGVTRAMYVQATGCGKTVTFSEIIRLIRINDKRPAIILAHREELLEQAETTIRRLIPSAYIEVEKGSSRASTFADVIVASLPTISRNGSTRLDWLARSGASVIIYDECHHACSDGSGRTLERFGAYRELSDPGRSFLVGCTATPHRLDNKPLEGSKGKATFEECVYRYPLLKAIQEKWLCDLRGYVVRTATDLSSVRTTAGDYNEKDLATAINADFDRTRKAIEHWQEVASDRPTIAFCVDVEHSKTVAEAFRDAGVTSATIDGSMNREVRKAIINKFKRGEIRVLANCMIATEGFDHPPVSCILLLRPTQSWSLYSQMVGRGTRLFKGKEDCVILDVVDNGAKHSLISAPMLLDLPQGIDLRGESIVKARDEMDALGERASWVKAGVWKDVLTEARQVDLFGIPPIPKVITDAGSKMQWLLLPSGYFLSCGKTDMFTRTAQIVETPLGFDWSLQSYPNNDSGDEGATMATPDSGTGDTLEDAVRACEAAVRRCWQDACRITDTTAPWRANEPSEKQLQMIQNLVRRRKIAGFDLSKIKTKGEASAVITHLMQGGN